MVDKLDTGVGLVSNLAPSLNYSINCSGVIFPHSMGRNERVNEHHINLVV